MASIYVYREHDTEGSLWARVLQLLRAPDEEFHLLALCSPKDEKRSARLLQQWNRYPTQHVPYLIVAEEGRQRVVAGVELQRWLGDLVDRVAKHLASSVEQGPNSLREQLHETVAQTLAPQTIRLLHHLITQQGAATAPSATPAQHVVPVAAAAEMPVVGGGGGTPRPASAASMGGAAAVPEAAISTECLSDDDPNLQHNDQPTRASVVRNSQVNVAEAMDGFKKREAHVATSNSSLMGRLARN